MWLSIPFEELNLSGQPATMRCQLWCPYIQTCVVTQIMRESHRGFRGCEFKVANVHPISPIFSLNSEMVKLLGNPILHIPAFKPYASNLFLYGMWKLRLSKWCLAIIQNVRKSRKIVSIIYSRQTFFSESEWLQWRDAFAVLAAKSTPGHPTLEQLKHNVRDWRTHNPLMLSLRINLVSGAWTGGWELINLWTSSFFGGLGVIQWVLVSQVRSKKTTTPNAMDRHRWFPS